MKVENLKDFNKLVKLCRQLGVDSIRVGDVECRLGPLPLKKVDRSLRTSPYSLPLTDPLANAQIANNIEYVDDVIETDELTEEQKLFYSATGESNT